MRLALVLLVAGCGPVSVPSVDYTTSYPKGDREIGVIDPQIDDIIIRMAE